MRIYGACDLLFMYINFFLPFKGKVKWQYDVQNLATKIWGIPSFKSLGKIDMEQKSGMIQSSELWSFQAEMK